MSEHQRSHRRSGQSNVVPQPINTMNPEDLDSEFVVRLRGAIYRFDVEVGQNSQKQQQWGFDYARVRTTETRRVEALERIYMGIGRSDLTDPRSCAHLWGIAADIVIDVVSKGKQYTLTGNTDASRDKWAWAKWHRLYEEEWWPIVESSGLEHLGERDVFHVQLPAGTIDFQSLHLPPDPNTLPVLPRPRADQPPLIPGIPVDYHPLFGYYHRPEVLRGVEAEFGEEFVSWYLDWWTQWCLERFFDQMRANFNQFMNTPSTQHGLQLPFPFPDR